MPNTPSRSTPGPAVRLAARRRAIKAAWRKTGLDDSAYRAMLRHVAGVETSTRLDLASAARVLDHLNRNPGFARGARPTRVRPECARLLTKIEALLADMKLPWQYGLAILRHNGADAWAFASAEQLHSLITALVIEQHKRQMASAVDAALAALGRTPDAGLAIARELGAARPEVWRRNLQLMHRMLVHLSKAAAPRGGEG